MIAQLIAHGGVLYWIAMRIAGDYEISVKELVIEKYFVCLCVLNN